MRKTLQVAFISLIIACVYGCSSAPKSAMEGRHRVAEAERTIERFIEADSSMREHFFETAKGWAVFPDVGKGGMGLGGAYGKGVLYENGEVVGYCDLAQGTIGLQLGGQVYSEIIFFEYERTLREFKSGTFEFAAQASAVAVTGDASANADYTHGVAVFTLAGKGLMYEASIGGQKFDYTPKR